MNNKYISWIPNTSGMLLYSLVEAFDYRIDRIVGDVFEVRESNSSVIQKDHLEPFLISMLIDLRDYEGNTNKYTRVIFTANPQEGNKLQGHIYFLDDLQNSGLYKSKNESLLIKNLANNVSVEEWDNTLTALIKHYKEMDPADAVYSILDYSLDETGKIIIEHIEHTYELVENAYRTEVEQAYYFIKFIFHKDRFHPKTNEYIVPILKMENNKDDDSFLKISKGIVRHILSKRKESADSFLDLKSLKGMITYVKVLLNMIEDETIRNKELKRLEFIDDGLTKELEQLRPVLLPNFRDFLDDFKSWSVIVFAIITPFIITSGHHYKDLNKYISDIALPYYGYGMLGLIVVIVAINILFQKKSYKNYFFTKKTGDILNWIMLKIKKYSRPSLSKNLFYKKIFPKFIDFEMKIRRIKLNLKKIIFTVISVVLGVLVIKGMILLDENYQKKELVSRDKKCNQVIALHNELNSTLDLNKTLKTYLKILDLSENKK